MNLSEFVYTIILKPKPIRALANWTLKLIVPKTVNVHGATIHLNPNDPVVSGALTVKVFEKVEIDFFCKHFKPNMTLLDIGANVGLYSGLALSQENFSGKVICFEPHGESQTYLKQTLASNNQRDTDEHIVFCPKAAADNDGKAVLHSNPDNKGDNRLYNDELLSDTQEVELTTVDSLCAEHGIETVDFVKIDIQGAEPLAINGAQTILQNSPDCVILSELWPHGLAQCGSNLDNYIATLEKLGFTIFKLDENGALIAFDLEAIRTEYTGRKYTNIVGFKGKYKP